MYSTMHRSTTVITVVEVIFLLCNKIPDIEYFIKKIGLFGLVVLGAGKSKSLDLPSFS